MAEPPTGATSQEPAPPRRSGPSGNPDAGALPRRGVLHGIAAAATAGAVGTLVGGCADQRRAPALSARTPRPPTATGGQASTSRSLAAIPPGLPYEIVHGPRERPLVALTFHGQGDPALATALLKEAERAGARVTVLAVGSWLDEQPRMARRILDGGHELGNHTLRHIDISAMSAADAFAEITGCAELLRRLTGSIGRWFRPSRAQYATATVKRLARQAGYRHCLSYDVDSLDYTDPGPAAVRRTVLGSVRGGSVVSLHLGHTGTVTALPAILDGLRRRGLRAVTATEMLTS